MPQNLFSSVGGPEMIGHVHPLGNPWKLVISRCIVIRFTVISFRACSIVQVLIPVSGRRSAGHLRSTAVFRDGQWHLTHLVLEFKGRTQKLVISDNRKQL